MLAQWRKGARERLPEIRAAALTRHRLIGELAHLSIPDVKEAEGGLRDATTLRGIVATWLVDVPHTELEQSRQALLDVRDVVQGIAGRASDRISPEMWSDLAASLGLDDERAAQVHVREIGRRITHLSRLAWRRVDGVLSRPLSPKAPRRPVLEPLAAGVALSAGEVVLDRKADPAGDPVLLLRAATAAAEHNVVLAPATAARLVRECAPLPEPWPDEARQLLVRLLASGRGLLEVWETLEETGALTGFLPEWERVRGLPHASVIHRFTVDRHVVETCIEASDLIRSVARPDVLMVASLLHDIGKGGLTEHSVAGEPIARGVATRMGFDAECIDLIAHLVRWHLLLATTATTRDPDDPATVDLVASTMGSVEALSLLSALTEADAKATSPKAWSSWRAGLIVDLARRARAALDSGVALPAITTDELEVPEHLDPASVSISVEPVPEGSRITTIALDRVGLLADFAAMLALQRVPVRAARVWAQGEYGVSVWEVAAEDVDAAILRTKYDAIVGGRADPLTRFAPPESAPGPDRRGPPRGQRAGDGARGPRGRPSGGRLPRVPCPGQPRHRRALGAPRHPRPAGGRRVLPAGGLGRGAVGDACRGGGARGAGGAQLRAGPGPATASAWAADADRRTVDDLGRPGVVTGGGELLAHRVVTLEVGVGARPCRLEGVDEPAERVAAAGSAGAVGVGGAQHAVRDPDQQGEAEHDRADHDQPGHPLRHVPEGTGSIVGPLSCRGPLTAGP